MRKPAKPGTRRKSQQKGAQWEKCEVDHGKRAAKLARGWGFASVCDWLPTGNEKRS